MSKRRSDTSTPPEPSPVVFLDENIEKDTALELCEYREWQIIAHRSHFAHAPDGQDKSIPDDEIIKLCGQNGWILVSCDDKMRYAPDNQAAAAMYGTKIFLFPNGHYKGGEYSAALVTGRHRLLAFAKKNVGPFFARICLTGDVYPLKQEQSAPQTSRDRTAAKYGAKVFQGRGASAGEVRESE